MAKGSSNEGYQEALWNALSSVRADGMLNPQVETLDRELPLGLAWLFPGQTEMVRVGGICFRWKPGVLHSQAVEP